MSEIDIENLSDKDREYILHQKAVRDQAIFGFLMWLFDNKYLTGEQVEAIADEKDIPLQ